jgi:NADH:ubiquinone oxidoreductase subunit 6 (subunit J)
MIRAPQTFNSTMESISAIGYAFYIRYADVLIFNSLVLTIALFGALVLAHNAQASN